MKRLLKTALIALGLTEISSSFLVAPLVHSRHSAVYHWTGSPRNLFLPVLLDILIVWALAALLLRLAKTPGKVHVLIWSAIILFAPSLVSKNWDLIWSQPSSSCTLWLFGIALAAWVLLGLLWRPDFAGRFAQAVDFMSTILLFTGIGAVLLLSETAFFAWQARSLNKSLAPHPTVMTIDTAKGKPPIIWIVFDELSYRQVYERRFPGLQLPAFDALASQSVVFTNAHPTANYTDRALPSLMSGEPVDNFRSSPSGRLSLHNPLTGEWYPFDQHQTVFQDAQDAGYRTAVIGWYIPYCRIAPAVLKECFTSYNISIKNGMTPFATVAQNMLQPVMKVASTGILHWLVMKLAPNSQFNRWDSNLHIMDYQSITDSADRVLRDRSADFVLLHLPIPHASGIFDRKRGQLTSGPSTYIDNLALSDNYLAHLRLALEQAGRWDSSTVIIMGDHSWRLGEAWTEHPDVSTEENEASQGRQFDERPAYIVKLPNQHVAVRENKYFPALNTRSMLDEIMRGEIKSPQELNAWAQQVH